MTVEVNKSNPTNWILWIAVQRESTLVTASAQTLNFTWNVSVTDVLGVPTIEILTGTISLAFIDLTDTPADYIWATGMFVQVNATADGLQFIDLQSRLEALTDLDLSNVSITLWEIGGDITFAVDTLIDWTNTTNTGVQYFDENYIGNYDWSTINYTNNSIVNYYQSTLNIDESTVNIDNSTRNSTNNIYNYFWDTIVYDSTSSVIFEWDIFIGGDIINITNISNNPGTVVQTWLGVAYTDLNNVLLCDLAYAVATPIDPTLLDSVRLIVSGVISGDDLGQWITGGNPAIYGNSGNLRGNILTPAIVNNSNFGCAFKFGDAKTIEVSDFWFTVPLTDTILGVKVEIIFNSTADTVSVDCITMTVYHTDGSTLASGIMVQEAGVNIAQAVTLNFETWAVVTDLWGGVVQVDINGTWQTPVTDEFTANGVLDTFTLTDIPLYTNIAVYFNGLKQKPASYTLTWSDVEFAIVPDNGTDILIDYLK